MRKKVLAFISLTLVCSILALAGCSNSARPGDGDSKDGENTAPEKSSLTVAVNAGPVDLDPHGTTDQNTYDVRYQIYEALVYVDATGKVCPLLATDWTWETDTSLLLTLREGVKFQNGSDFDAEDVMYSLRRAADSAYAGTYLENVDLEASGITDDGKVKLVLTQPVSALVSRLALVMMVDKETWEEASEEKMLAEPVGTGAYKLKQYISGDRLEFDANESYWDGKPYFDTLTMRIISESASRALEIEAGTVDVALQIQAADLAILEADEEITMNTTPSYMITYLGFDCTKEPYNNTLVRQAMSYALDREAICSLVYENLAMPANAGRLSEVYWGFAGDQITNYSHNPEKAKSLLTEAGYSDGFEMTLLVSEAEQDELDMSEIIQSQLGEVGITVNIDVMENAAYLNTIVDGGFDAFLCNSTGSSSDPGEATKSFISTRPTWSNTTRYYNDELTAMIEEGQQMVDEGQKLAHFTEVQRIISDECPWVFLVHNCTTFATRNEIKGLNAYPSSAHFFKEAYIG